MANNHRSDISVLSRRDPGLVGRVQGARRAHADLRERAVRRGAFTGHRRDPEDTDQWLARGTRLRHPGPDPDAGACGTIFTVFALPPMYRDGRQFSADWPRHLDELTEGIQRLPFGSKIDPTELQKYAAEIVGGAGGLFLNLAGGIFGLFTAIILTAYFIIDGERTFPWAVSLFPVDQQSAPGRQRSCARKPACATG